MPPSGVALNEYSKATSTQRHRNIARHVADTTRGEGRLGAAAAILSRGANVPFPLTEGTRLREQWARGKDDLPGRR